MRRSLTCSSGGSYDRLGEKKPDMFTWRLLRLKTVLRRLQQTSDLFEQQLKGVKEGLDRKSKLGELKQHNSQEFQDDLRFVYRFYESGEACDEVGEA